jgi:transcriptional regulator with XRE-family HTH domain
VFFEELQDRLLVLLRARVQGGEFTERSLAKLTGISQPHVHNVLKGARKFSPELADSILKTLGISTLDLFDSRELIAHLSRHAAYQDQRYCQVGVLDGILGPGQAIPKAAPGGETYTIPHSQLKAVTDAVAARLGFDPEMRGTFAGGEVVLLDQSEMGRTYLEPQSLYVVLSERGALIRKLRQNGDTLWMRNSSDVDTGETVELDGRNVIDVVLARVVWLNKRRRWGDAVYAERGA